jgi:hypothetical protein
MRFKKKQGNQLNAPYRRDYRAFGLCNNSKREQFLQWNYCICFYPEDCIDMKNWEVQGSQENVIHHNKLA